MRAILNNNKIEILFKYRFELVSLVKSFDNRQYSPTSRSWFIPIAGARPAIEKLLRQRFLVDPAVIQAVKEDERLEKESKAMAVMDNSDFESNLPLYPFQKVGANFLYQIGSGILGDSPGLGKTLQVLAVAEKIKAQKVLIFTPSSVKWQFAGEIERFLPGNKVVVVDGSVDKRRELWTSEARFYIANYELLLRDFDFINSREWDLLIADEGHRLANPFAKQVKAIKKLRAKRKITATGTPVSNRPNDLWSLLDFTNPGCMGSYFAFVQKYCVKNQFGGIWGYKEMDDFKKVVRRYLIRRTREEVLPELPTKQDIDVPFELSETERELYDKIRKEILFEIKKEDISKLEQPTTIQYTLTKLLRLQQLTDSMELLGDNKTSSKVEVLKELLNENEGEKFIVYTKFAKFADILERELADWKPLKITGEVTDRQEIVDAFNTQDVNQVLIITDAASYGLNLQFKCSVIVCMDLPFSLAKLEQITGRIYRIGQKNNVRVYSLLGIKTVDYHLKKILEKKKALSQEILTMNDIQNMLSI